MPANAALQERKLRLGHLLRTHSLKSRTFGVSASGLVSSFWLALMTTRMVPSGKISTAAAPSSFAARTARTTSASVNRAAVLLIFQMHLHRTIKSLPLLQFVDLVLPLTRLGDSLRCHRHQPGGLLAQDSEGDAAVGADDDLDGSGFKPARDPQRPESVTASEGIAAAPPH